ncbi:MAG: hypothetical protein GQ574_09830 [Crocinitomix sp.]|nr:hypothetical protein [Crocinitomix sp.]
MKKKIVFIGFMCLGIFQAQAQDQIVSGGFGHFSSGPVFSNIGKIGSYMSSADVLGPIEIRSVGVLSGGEGYGILGEKVIIGGGGFGVNFPKVSNERAVLSPTSWAGKFNIGYIFWNKNLSLMYAYGGMGAGGYAYDITNKGSDSIFFDRYKPLLEGESKTYSISGATYEMGVSYKKFVMTSKSREECRADGELSKVSGLMLGVDLGCNFALAVNGWSDVGVGPAYFNPVFTYFRVTIGGGGANVTNCVR